MTATMLVLEPIWRFRNRPSTGIYAYRAGRNAQQAVVEVEELLFSYPEVVDADLAGLPCRAFPMPSF